MSGWMKEILEEALFRPDDRLIAALDRKLTVVEKMLLQTWLENERELAALAEWNKHKDRIKE